MFGDGWWVRRALIAGMVTLWSMRLGTHLYLTRGQPSPGGRRTLRQLRKRMGARISFRKMFGRFFPDARPASVDPARVSHFLSFASTAASLSFHPLEIAGAVLWLLALAGEAVADTQLTAFKRNPANERRVCDAGTLAFQPACANYFSFRVVNLVFIFRLCARLGLTVGVDRSDWAVEHPVLLAA